MTPEAIALFCVQGLAGQAVELQLVEAISHETVRRVLKKTNSSRGARWAG
jgi:hypothetical protein